MNEPILRLMNSPENLMSDVKGYMGIIYAGLLVTAAYDILAAVLRALGDSKVTVIFSDHFGRNQCGSLILH